MPNGGLDAKALLDSLDVGIVALAPDWTIIEWTGGAGRITGLPPDRVLGRAWWHVFPTAKGTHVERILQDVAFDGEPRSYLAPSRLPEFGEKVFEVRATRGPRHHLTLLFREVREELAPESRAAHILAAFEHERRFYRQLFEALPIPALVLTVDGQILETNPQVITLLGAANADSLRGRALADWIPAAQREAFAAAVRDAVQKRQEIHVEIEFAGEPVREIAAVLENLEPHRGIPKVLFLAIDVSREVLLQRKLLQADRLAQLGAIVSGVAHELNNPLAAIAAFAEMIGVEAKVAEVRESAEIIHSEAMRAGRMVQTLLDFARQRPQVRQPVDLRDVVQRVLPLHRNALRKARVQVFKDLPEDLPAVRGDPQELQQVLLNAVVNAEQAMAGTGRPGTLRIAARATPEFVVVTVEDTGPGVPPELLGRVFEPFFTTKGDEGSGLGLAISFGAVRGMGGRIWLENVEDGGARLLIELPADTGRPVRPAPSGVAPAGRAVTLLILDDEENVRRGVTRMAERLGHRVTSVARFDDALDRLRAPGVSYDALLLDVHLDEGHTAFEVFDALSAEGRGRERRIVFTTGDSVSAQTRDALVRCERPVLKKPFNLEELREILDRVAGS